VCENPLSTQDDVAASLVRDFKIPEFAVRGEDNDRNYRHIDAAIAFVRSSPAPARLRKIRLERIFASAPQGRGAGKRRVNSRAAAMPVRFPG
jgi:hypothetical protein